MFFSMYLAFLHFSSFVDSQTIDNVVVKLPSSVNTVIKLPKWKPKTSTTTYDPTKVDWRSVIAGCRATCRYDRRLCNFYVRAAAHDSLSVSEGFGGADGSVLLTQDELRRTENKYDSFAFLLSANALALAQRYDTSVADIVAVCGAVATEYQGGPTIVSHTVEPNEPFSVGRFDSTTPNPTNSLPGANINTQQFSTFAQSRNLTIREMTALMGSHSLIDNQGCERTNGSQCDPHVESCTDLRMFRWSNKYYRDVCTPTVRINIPPVRSTMPLQTHDFVRRQSLCRFTSPELRKREIDIFDQETRLVLGVTDADALLVDLDTEMEHVSWIGRGQSRPWMYTVNDAWLGLACQNRLPVTDYNTEISSAMNSFKTSVPDWDTTYTRAYKKMVNTGASWSTQFAITGDECPSGYVSALKGVTLDCSLCDQNARRSGTYNCPANCKCKTAFSNSVRFYTNVIV